MKSTVLHVGSGVLEIPPQKGGAVEMIIYEICSFLSKKKVQSIILDNRNESFVRNGIRTMGVAVPRFPGLFLLRLTELLFGLSSARKIQKISGKEKTIVHMHTVFTALPIVFLRNTLSKSTKLVYTSHNPAWTEENIDFLNAFIREIEKFVVRKSDVVTVGTGAARAKIMKKAGLKEGNIRTVYNFVDTGKFRAKKYDWKKKNGVKGRMVLFVGKLIPNKGVEYLLRAAPAVVERFPDTHFVFAGPSSFESEKKNKWLELCKELGIEDSVTFTGSVSNQELYEIYKAADVFCFPTMRETFGVVLAEAMAAGLPVISSDIPVVREVVGDAGILVPRCDVKAIVEAIERVLSDRKLSGAMKKKSLKRKEMFEKNEVLQGYLDLYQEIENQ
ncbi:MAG: glycosyltransferase family 4 protein [Candidatus Aenigmarchaeota archaeon]|nr:glycosyltransferase family 4 protein [Candidatus Aenigmarchaeota archaeon]